MVRLISWASLGWTALAMRASGELVADCSMALVLVVLQLAAAPSPCLESGVFQSKAARDAYSPALRPGRGGWRWQWRLFPGRVAPLLPSDETVRFLRLPVMPAMPAPSPNDADLVA